MILLWIFTILSYIIFNAVITISWVATDKCKHKILVSIVLMLFGLPIMITIITIGIIAGIIEVVRNRSC